jgi:lipoprotein-releasing system ATP-binding protein
LGIHVVEPILKADGLRKEFGRGSGSIAVLSGCDLTVQAGEWVAVAGSSGSGKSTLLHVLGGLMHPDAGTVSVGNRSLYALGDPQRARLRNRRIGFVFQFHHLLPEFTAMENILLPGRIAGVALATLRERASQLLRRMGLADRAEHKPGELSGGEQQRVAVARALINEPQIVLADEPSGNLDQDNSELLHGLLEEMARERSLALVVATHSPALARRAHRTVLLREGRLQSATAIEEWA